MKKLLLDTDLYIEFLRRGTYHKLIRDVYAYETPGIYFSSVVIQELLAGAIGKAGRKNVETLYQPFESAGRIVTPTHNNWKEAGDILSLLRIKRKDLRTKIPVLINDILIALSARNIGATVYTSNIGDFQTIKEILTFSLVVIEKEA
ncbi:MAG: PIN domain protein [Candidatus Scalindua rubra]|uniref:PIN domain protein n=1 Tax=Candidatus Scalindua rubra TaxID=1872076 RepID=A0A1E3XF70_9BACT|nr:MAG: PIN domain protein [Candidatus Scalindua rubra]